MIRRSRSTRVQGRSDRSWMDSQDPGAESEFRGSAKRPYGCARRGLGLRFPCEETLLSNPRIAAEHPARPIVRLVTTAHRLTQHRQLRLRTALRRRACPAPTGWNRTASSASGSRYRPPSTGWRRRCGRRPGGRRAGGRRPPRRRRPVPRPVSQAESTTSSRSCKGSPAIASAVRMPRSSRVERVDIGAVADWPRPGPGPRGPAGCAGPAPTLVAPDRGEELGIGPQDRADGRDRRRSRGWRCGPSGHGAVRGGAGRARLGPLEPDDSAAARPAASRRPAPRACRAAPLQPSPAAALRSRPGARPAARARSSRRRPAWGPGRRPRRRRPGGCRGRRVEPRRRGEPVEQERGVGHGGQGVLLQEHGAGPVAGQRRPGDGGQASRRGRGSPWSCPGGKCRASGSQTRRRRVSAAGLRLPRARSPAARSARPRRSARPGPGPPPHRPALGQHEADVARCAALALLPLDLRVLLEAV